ncbi:MAG: tetratricopeptide repeat protein, partial [Melioribacteraceae bacterium]
MFFEKAKKLFAWASLFLILLGLSGCGIWTDFTTYFNTYYNAKTLFDQVEEEIIKQKKDIFAFREDLQAASQYGGQQTSQYGTQTTIPVNNTQSTNQFVNQPNVNQFANQPNANQFSNRPATPQLSGTLNDNLKKVVEKCSKILQYEKNSSYFADALFITGKALYYQQEYARAQRKFTELAGLGKTKYSSENKLWLAKTDLQLHDFDEGLKLIDEVKTESLNESNDALFNDASITKISFLIFREENNAAIEECKDFLSKSKDDEISALVAYQMGKIYLLLDDTENAFQAFSSVSKYSPTVDVDFKSRFESAKLLKSLKRLDESEKAFNDLRYLGKFKNYLDQVLIEVGQIDVEKDRINPAIDIFRDVDTTYRQFPTSGIAEAKLGDIYRKKLGLYDSAYVYYSRAAISMAPREDKEEARVQAANLNKYFSFKEEESDIEKKIEYKNNPELFVRDSVDYEIAYRQYMD